ncbi:hypothetical protein F2P56_011121 [Juglans regia]|uniref:Pre-mRNA-splicing factor ATP-dependent RNA helicase DHX16 n=2 Tax=Juglans regia TaxID=51240 RepID=A0A2I4DDK4_JUGRE|nr:putative pre-mRNA-splicing factor ATP-dependent RNA helicase DHX16 [Juglans regia]XP_018805216.1 putative pre-mRNA-splicing factor ATP-dependent RNA helicase DHX16 [Juglans regia]XP_035546123.1 putative pre-mRNA-splicing factor ATP-dependent RNA helicase DHX16 [Juglans regia]XP_035546124.1 putative pre-mRNA-splicing factor ATP-dependent RNA helicase DHX16 [Juglans regia]KAF5470617.1 hypothetical protein F2P56_011121 [Juglans regia]
MKTVSGKVLSSKPISLKKATSILSTFASADNGASPAICAYLRRALASFKELRHHEKEVGTRRSERKHERPKQEVVSEVEAVPVNPTRSAEVSKAPSQKQKRHRLDSNISGSPVGKDDKPTQSVVSGPETSHGVGDNVGEKGKREKRGKNKQKGEFGEFRDNGGTGSNLKIEAEDDRGQETGEGDDGVVGTENQRKRDGKKKKKDGDYVENVENDGIEEAKGKFRKKKMIKEIKEEIKEIGLDDSETAEQQSNKKKKKIKIDGDKFDNNGVGAEDKYDGSKMRIEEVKKESKKRKIEVEEKKVVDDSEEQWSKKKKRRKTD